MYTDKAGIDLESTYDQTVLTKQLRRDEIDILLKNIRKAGNITELEHIQTHLPQNLYKNPQHVAEIFTALNQAILNCHQASSIHTHPFFTHTSARNYVSFEGNIHKNPEKQIARMERLTTRDGRHTTRKAYVESTTQLLNLLTLLAIAEGQQEQKTVSHAAMLTEDIRQRRRHDQQPQFNSHKKFAEAAVSPAFWQQPPAEPMRLTPPAVQKPKTAFRQPSMKKR
jgi:hypothetical protein